jgi:hypothetical protein
MPSSLRLMLVAAVVFVGCSDDTSVPTRREGPVGTPWARSIGGGGEDRARVIAAADDGVVVVGTFEGSTSVSGEASITADESGVFAVRFGQGGDLKGATRIVRSSGFRPIELTGAAAVDGELVIVGYVRDTAVSGDVVFGPAQAMIGEGTSAVTIDGVTSGPTGFIARLEASGDLRWLVRVTNAAVASAARAPDGAIVLLGSARTSASLGEGADAIAIPGSVGRAFLARVDSNGRPEWVRGTELTEDLYRLRRLAVSMSGEIAAASKRLVLRFAPDGSPRGSAETFGIEDEVSALAFTDSSALLIAGSYRNRIMTMRPSEPDFGVFLEQHDGAGARVWTRSIARSALLDVAGIGVGASGHIFVAGHYLGSAIFGDEAVQRAFRTEGRLPYFLELDGSGGIVGVASAFGSGIIRTETLDAIVGGDGALYAAGTYEAPISLSPSAGGVTLATAGGFDGFVVRAPAIELQPASDPPRIIEFTSSASSVVRGGRVTLRWSVESARQVQLTSSPEGVVRHDSSMLTGELTSEPIVEGTRFRLIAIGDASTSSEIVVSVTDPRERLLEGTFQPSSLATDGQRLFWLESADGPYTGALVTAELDGSRRTTLATRPRFPGRLIAKNGALYWTERGPDDEGVVMTSAPDGSGQRPIDDRAMFIGGLAVDATHAYYTFAAPSTEQRVARRALDGSGSQEVLLERLGFGEPAFAIDETSVYASRLSGLSAAIVRVSKDGAETATIASLNVQADVPRGMAVDGDALYLLLASQTLTGLPVARVMQISISSGASQVVSESQDLLASIDPAIDADHFYWFELSGLRRVSRRGPPAPELVVGFGRNESPNPRGLALTSTHVYWLLLTVDPSSGGRTTKTLLERTTK